jgi:hypothetical protein
MYVKKIKYLLVLMMLVLPLSLKAENLTAFELWEKMTQVPALNKNFTGLFYKLGLDVIDTNETLTLHDNAGQLSVSQGLDKDIDYSVRLNSSRLQQVAPLYQQKEVKLSTVYKTVALLFAPLAEANLSHPLMSNWFLRWMSTLENVVHLYIQDPLLDKIYVTSMVFKDEKWHVFEFLQGKSKRTYRLTIQQAVDYQRHLYQAIRDDSWSGWASFATWYLDWRWQYSE